MHTHETSCIYPGKRQGFVGVEFAGVRNYNGSCICVGKFARGMPRRGGPRFIHFTDSHRFNVNNSNIVFVGPSSRTSFRVRVCGTSNAETRVYKGNVHYITGCIRSGKLASRARFSVIDNKGIGCVSLAIRGNVAGTVHISVKRPVLATTRIPIISGGRRSISRRVMISGRGCQVAYISVKGPRTIIFISDATSFPLRRVKPRFRGRRHFPHHAGARFMRIMSPRCMGVQI